MCMQTRARLVKMHAVAYTQPKTFRQLHTDVVCKYACMCIFSIYSMYIFTYLTCVCICHPLQVCLRLFSAADGYIIYLFDLMSAHKYNWRGVYTYIWMCICVYMYLWLVKPLLHICRAALLFVR